MGKIKKLKSNELVGGVDREDVYPITSTKAVFDNSNTSQDDINKNRLDRIEVLEETMPTTVKSITINGGQRINTVDENGNVDLTIYSDGGQDYEGLTEVVANLRDIVGENPEEPQSGTILERVDTLEDAVGTGGSVDQRIENAINSLDSERTVSTTHLNAGIRITDGKLSGFDLEESDIASASDLQNLDEYTHSIYQTKIEPISTRPATGEAGIIYRVPNSGGTTYTDWMYSDGWKELATFNIATLNASDVNYDNSTSGLTAENVQEALDKVSADIPLLATNGNEEDDLDIADIVGNILARFKDGHLETKECTWVVNTSADGLFVADSNGNILAWLIGGQLIMGGFNSMDIGGATKADYYDIVKPTASIKIYNTCNDIDKTTNKWGINSRNYGLSVFLDHFIKPSSEKKAKFDKNGKTFVNLSQKIVGQTTTWNNGVTSYEESKNYNLNEGSDEITLVNRQILNSATSSLFPKILQIGDSVTQAWFANYPTIASAPTASWSWAKYFFEKDKLQKGSGFDSLLIGTYTSVNVDYDGTQFKAWAEGRGGWTAQTYWSSSSNGGVSNPFYDSTLQHFSLQSYLNKYKTLDDDGVTRLVVGSTAGTSVTNVNAYDVCTPNVVVLQLGMNGTLAVWQTYMVNIIQQIKSEFPNMKIIISCLDAALCMFPSLYPEYDDISLTDYDGAHARMIDIMKWAIDTLPTQTYTVDGNTYNMTEENGIYVIYTGAIMPMPYSCNVREIVNPLVTLQEGLRRYVGVDAIERVKHPSRFAHAAIGYELYSAIKWVLMN